MDAVLSTFCTRVPCPYHAAWTADALPHQSPLSQQLHAGLCASRSHWVKTFLHQLLDHLCHFTMGHPLDPWCVVGQCRDEEGKRWEEKERGGEVYTLGPSAASGASKDGPPPLCIPLFSTYFPLFTAVLQDSPSLVLHTGSCPHCHLRWLITKHCCMLKSKRQTCLMPPPPQEASSQLKNTTTHDTRRLIKTINQRLFTPMSSTYTSIVLRVCGESESPPVLILQLSCSRC